MLKKISFIFLLFLFTSRATFCPALSDRTNQYIGEQERQLGLESKPDEKKPKKKKPSRKPKSNASLVDRNSPEWRQNHLIEQHFRLLLKDSNELLLGFSSDDLNQKKNSLTLFLNRKIDLFNQQINSFKENFTNCKPVRPDLTESFIANVLNAYSSASFFEKQREIFVKRLFTEGEPYLNNLVGYANAYAKISVISENSYYLAYKEINNYRNFYTYTSRKCLVYDFLEILDGDLDRKRFLIKRIFIKFKSPDYWRENQALFDSVLPLLFNVLISLSFIEKGFGITDQDFSSVNDFMINYNIFRNQIIKNNPIISRVDVVASPINHSVNWIDDLFLDEDIFDSKIEQFINDLEFNLALKHVLSSFDE